MPMPVSSIRSIPQTAYPPMGKTAVQFGFNGQSAADDTGAAPVQEQNEGKTGGPQLIRRGLVKFFGGVAPILTAFLWSKGVSVGTLIGLPLAYASGMVGRFLKKGLASQEQADGDLPENLKELANGKTDHLKAELARGLELLVLAKSKILEYAQPYMQRLDESGILKSNNMIGKTLQPFEGMIKKLGGMEVEAIQNSPWVKAITSIGIGAAINYEVAQHPGILKASSAGMMKGFGLLKDRFMVELASKAGGIFGMGKK